MPKLNFSIIEFTKSQWRFSKYKLVGKHFCHHKAMSNQFITKGNSSELRFSAKKNNKSKPKSIASPQPSSADTPKTCN